MQPFTQLPARLAASLLVAAAFSACGSSDPAVTQQGPGGSGELPTGFAMFISDRTPQGTQLQGEVRPYLYDFSTGELRNVGGGLPGNRDIAENGAGLSPDGRWLYATVGEFLTYSMHVIDLQEGTTRTIPLPLEESGFQDGGGEPPFMRFSPDSSRVMIIADTDDGSRSALFTCAIDGTGLQRVQVDDQDLEPVGWLGTSNDLLVIYFDETIGTEVLAVLDSSGSLSAPIQLSDRLDARIRDVTIAADGSAVAAIVQSELSPTTDLFEPVAHDFAAATTQQFVVAGVEATDVRMSDTGEYVAIFYQDPVSGNDGLRIGETATGTLEIATVPAAHSGDIDIEPFLASWEPGGSRLAFVSAHRDEFVSEITIASLGTAPMTVEPTVVQGTDSRNLTWSPSGRFLAYLDESVGDPLRLFDADGVEAPQTLTDTAFSSDARGIRWAPDSQHLLAAEEIDSSNTVQVVVYGAPTFERVGVVGPAYGSQQDQPFVSGLASVAFSRDGRHVLWSPNTPGADADRLLAVDFDDIAAPAVDVTGTVAGGTTPQISQFWLRQ